MGKGTLYWITGLSGAGKTTIGNALYYELKKKQDNLIILDGDILKNLVGNSLGYSQSDRKKRAYYYSNLCKTLTDQGISVIICTIAMYDEVRDWNRANIEKYVEIFLNVNKDILMKRDRKGLYSGQSAGKIENVAGMDQDVEFPKNPDIIIENDGTITVSDCVNKIMEYKVNVKDTFDRDVNYWNQYYLRKEKEIQEPSDFAKFVLPYMETHKKIMDIGCGNGRDSIYFSQNGLEVTGIDASEEAISYLNQYNMKNSMFVCDDFVTCKALYQVQYDYFYSRWTIHAVSEKQEWELLKNVSSAIKKKGLFFIEVRSIKDDLFGKGTKIAKNTYSYNDHFRRFIVKKELEEKLEKLEFEIIYEKEDKGLSKTTVSDPVLIRIIARKR